MAKVIKLRLNLLVYQESEAELFEALSKVKPRQRGRFVRNCLIARFPPGGVAAPDVAGDHAFRTETRATGAPTVAKNEDSDLLMEMAIEATDRVEREANGAITAMAARQ